MPTARKHVNNLSEINRKRNSGRYKSRESEPKPVALLGSAPEHLDKVQKGIWRELVGRVAPGVLFACDAYVVELTVRLTEKMRAGQLTSSETGQYRGCLASLGITPADRSRVSVPATPQKSPLERILDGDDEAEEAAAEAATKAQREAVKISRVC